MTWLEQWEEQMRVALNSRTNTVASSFTTTPPEDVELLKHAWTEEQHDD